MSINRFLAAIFRTSLLASWSRNTNFFLIKSFIKQVEHFYMILTFITHKCQVHGHWAERDPVEGTIRISGICRSVMKQQRVGRYSILLK